MTAHDYIKEFATDNLVGMISYESIIELMEGYHKHQINNSCKHTWFPTTKKYKRAWKCTECKKIVHEKP
jgi:hypothetical protein